MKFEIIVKDKDGAIKARRGKRRTIKHGLGAIVEEIHPDTHRWRKFFPESKKAAKKPVTI